MKQKYQVGGTLSIDADYQMRKSGKILLYHHGHDHETDRTFSPAMAFWTFSANSMAMEIIAATDESVYDYIHSSGLLKEYTRGGESR
jgi:hypothetical protein